MTTPDSARLSFRELTSEDYGDAASVLLDDEVLQRMHPLVSEELVRRWLARRLEHYRTIGYSHWHVSLKETGEFVGIIGVVPERVEDETFTGLGYLVHPRHRRRGYAFEGAQACLEWAFRELRPEKVIAEIDEGNAVSRHLAEKLGMTCERTYLRFNGEAEVPYCLYQISVSSFCPNSRAESS